MAEKNTKEKKAAPPKAAQPKKAKKQQEQKAGPGKKTAAAATLNAKGKRKSGWIKKVALPVVCAFLVGVIAFSIFMLMDRNSEKEESAEAAETTEAADAGKAAESTEGETAAAQEKPKKYSVDFSPGEVKTIQDVDDKNAEPRFDITVHSARELSAADKGTYGLTKETGRLAMVEMDVRLYNESDNWDLYNRRFADPKGNWLDEIKPAVGGDSDGISAAGKENLFVRLPGDRAATDEKISLSVYTASWNGKKKADGKCDITVTPAPQAGQRSEPVIRNVDTEFGNWTGNTYTSSQLNMSFTLPTEWDMQTNTINANGGKKSVEGMAVRTDKKATLQISVDSQAADKNEMDQIAFITNLLSKAVNDYTISQPYHQTIAGKEYLGFTYSYADVDYQVFFHKIDDSIVEIALHFPSEETEQANLFLDCMKALT